MTLRLVLALASYGAVSGFTAKPLPRLRTDTVRKAWGPDWDLQPESTCIHGGWAPDPATTARAVPVYRTGPYQFESTERRPSFLH